MRRPAGRQRLAALLGALWFAATALAPASAATPASPPAVAPAITGSTATASAQRGRITEVRDVVAGVAQPQTRARSVLAAADGLDVTTSTTYLVDPAARKVTAAVDVTAVNRLPVTAGVRYYFAGVNLAVQPEATAFAADEAGVRDRATTAERTGYRLLSILFHARLYVGQTAHVHLAFELPAGAPRSASGVRVGAAYAAFVVWAFGDSGSVTVTVPAGFVVDSRGNAMTAGTGVGGSSVLASAVDDASAWAAWIDARYDRALTSQSLSLPAGQRVVVQAWPEDPAWQRRVAAALTRGIPALATRIGLPWPIDGELSVKEVSGAELEGYAGFYRPDLHQITISEDLDPLTIVHEASHVWFNSALFADRWITEGLANEYAWRTLDGLGVSAAGPKSVRTSAKEAFALDAWGPPAAIKTRTQDAREQWAYDASWTVVREVVAEVGEPGMARVFAAAEAGTTAYPGVGTAERSTLPSDWRRFADLAEEVGGGSGVAEMLAPWALTADQRALLAPRAAARTQYHALVAAGGDWTAPAVVRGDMDAWDFADAETAIAVARATLGSRDAIRVEASSVGLAVPAALRGDYETAVTPDALARTAGAEAALFRALDAVAAADRAMAAPREGLVVLGLLGQDPSTTLAAAKTAWASGDAAIASQDAAAVADALSVAADAGRLRLASLVAALVALALLGGAAIAIGERRGRHRAQAVASAVPSATIVQIAPPAAPEPYPILPANATAGEPPEPLPDVVDEGAQ